MGTPEMARGAVPWVRHGQVELAKTCSCIAFAMRRVRRNRGLPSQRKAVVMESLVSSLQLLEELIVSPVPGGFVRGGGLEHLAKVASSSAPWQDNAKKGERESEHGDHLGDEQNDEGETETTVQPTNAVHDPSSEVRDGGQGQHEPKQGEGVGRMASTMHPGALPFVPGRAWVSIQESNDVYGCAENDEGRDRIRMQTVAWDDLGVRYRMQTVAWDDRGVWRPDVMLPCLLWARECSQPSGPERLHPTVGWMVPGALEQMHGPAATPTYTSAVHEQSNAGDSDASTDTDGLIEGVLAQHGAQWDRGGFLAD